MLDILSKMKGLANQVHPLSTLVRFNTKLRIKDESVAEHSFYVALFVMQLREYYKFDLARAVQMAIVHDLAEIYVSDIPHNVKKMSDELDTAIKLIEKEAWVNFEDRWYLLWQEVEEQQTVEAKIVKLADIVSCIQYTDTERNLGNTTMTDVADSAHSRFIELIGELDDYAIDNHI